MNSHRTVILSFFARWYLLHNRRPATGVVFYYFNLLPVLKMIKEDNLGDTNKHYLTLHDSERESLFRELQNGAGGRKLLWDKKSRTRKRKIENI